MNEISVLFSGGADSTLAAAYAAEQYDKVHLLTYHHFAMFRHGKQLVSRQALEDKYEGGIISFEIDINRLYKSIYLADFKNRIKVFGSYVIPWVCGACKMAMHINTIDYNRKNGIRVTYDGANAESAKYFPAQMPGYIERLKKLYGDYDMVYETPVYDIDRADNELEKMGVGIKPDCKKEHVLYSNQHSCLLGLLLHTYYRGYFNVFFDNERADRLSREYLSTAIDEYAISEGERR